LANDGVHPGEEGHWLMAKALMSYFNSVVDQFHSWEAYLNSTPDMPELYKLVSKRQAMMKDAWLTYTGHERPGMNKGLAIKEAKKQYREFDREIRK